MRRALLAVALVIGALSPTAVQAGEKSDDSGLNTSAGRMIERARRAQTPAEALKSVERIQESFNRLFDNLYDSNKENCRLILQETQEYLKTQAERPAPDENWQEVYQTNLDDIEAEISSSYAWWIVVIIFIIIIFFFLMS